MTNNFDLNTKEGKINYDDMIIKRNNLYKQQQELIDEIGKVDIELKKYSF